MQYVVELFLMLIVVAAAISTWALIGIYAVLKKGINQHIQAMQAIYESNKQKDA